MLAPHADALIGHVRANRDRYVDELKAWIAVPSISAQPDHAADVRRSAEHAVERMLAAGLTVAAGGGATLLMNRRRRPASS